MTDLQRQRLGGKKRTHYNCRKACRVARPGKTAQDKARNKRDQDIMEMVNESNSN